MSVEALLCIGGHDGAADVASVELMFPSQGCKSALSISNLTSGKSAFGLVSLLPLPLDLNSAESGDAIMLIGGCQGAESLASTECLHLPTNTWSSASVLLEPRSAPCAAMIDRTVVVCGGFNRQCLASVEIRDEVRNVWKAGPPMSIARCSFGMMNVGNVVFTCGGSGSAGMIGGMEMLDLRCKLWSARAPMPQACSCFGAAQVDENSFVVAGGHNGCETLGIVSMYDLRADKWQAMPHLATARSAASLAMVDSTLWAIGGYDGQQTLAKCEAIKLSDNDLVLEMEMQIPRTGLGVLPVSLNASISSVNGHDDLDKVSCRSEGNQVQKRRIVSLSQAHTLMLYELKAAERVVAIDTFSSQRPEGFSEVPLIDSFSPDLAAICRLKPDAIIVSFPSQLNLVEPPCPIHLLEAPRGDETVEEICRQIHLVASLVGAEDAAVDLASNVRRRLESMHVAAAPLFDCSYFIELDTDLYTAKSSSFLGHIFSNCLGLRNSADFMKNASGKDYFPASMEELVIADPHFYIIAHTGEARIESDSQASQLRVVKNANVIRTPIHYDRVAWSPALLDIIEESLRRMLQRRHGSVLPPFVFTDASRSPFKVAEALYGMLCLDGLDLLKPFCVGWYNNMLSELSSTWAQQLRPLPDFDHGDACLAFLVGNTRAVWQPFTMWMRADSARFMLRNPFDTFVLNTVERICGSVLRGVKHEVFWSCDESSERMVAMQRVAEVAGLAHLDHALHLSVHPVYGTWISLRAVIVCDLPAPMLTQPKPLESLLSIDEEDTAAKALQAALDEHADPGKLCKDLHGPGLESCERAMDVWQRWIALRDVPSVGRQYRFHDAQLDYHYTKNRDRLRTSTQGQHDPVDLQSHQLLLVAGGHNGKEDVASAELFSIDSFGSLSSIGNIASMSKPRGGSSVALLGEEALVIGGNEGSSPSSLVEAFSFKSRTWRTCESLDTPRMCPNSVTTSDSVFVLGGLLYDGQSPVVLQSTEVLKLGMDKWMPGPSLLVARCSAGSACLGKRLFICGGFDHEKPLASMEALDPREGRWTSKASLQCARSCFACAAINDHHILACGGHVGQSAADATYGPSKLCELYDERKNCWRTASRLEIAAVSPAAVLVGCRLCVIGGYDGMTTLHQCQSLLLQDDSDLLDVNFEIQEFLAMPRAGPVVVAY